MNLTRKEGWNSPYWVLLVYKVRIKIYVTVHKWKKIEFFYNFLLQHHSNCTMGNSFIKPWEKYIKEVKFYLNNQFGQTEKFKHNYSLSLILCTCFVFLVSSGAAEWPLVSVLQSALLQHTPGSTTAHLCEGFWNFL